MRDGVHWLPSACVVENLGEQLRGHWTSPLPGWDGHRGLSSATQAQAGPEARCLPCTHSPGSAQWLQVSVIGTPSLGLFFSSSLLGTAWPE